MRSYFNSAEEGGWVITFPDVPEATTQGDTVASCIKEASDALEEAIIGRINTGEDIPVPSPVKNRQYCIPVPVQAAFKAAFCEEIKSQGLSKVELATWLGIDEKEVSRLLDPHHLSRLPRIAEILGFVGKHIVVGVEDAKEMAASGG